MSAHAACDNCRFWNKGECRRMPAQVATVWVEGAAITESKWPNTLPEDLCGEFQTLDDSEQEADGGTHFRKCRGELACMKSESGGYEYFVRVPITAEEYVALLTMREKAPVFIGVELPNAKRL